METDLRKVGDLPRRVHCFHWGAATQAYPDNNGVDIFAVDGKRSTTTSNLPSCDGQCAAGLVSILRQRTRTLVCCSHHTSQCHAPWCRPAVVCAGHPVHYVSLMQLSRMALHGHLLETMPAVVLLIERAFLHLEHVLALTAVLRREINQSCTFAQVFLCHFVLLKGHINHMETVKESCHLSIRCRH